MQGNNRRIGNPATIMRSRVSKTSPTDRKQLLNDVCAIKILCTLDIIF